MFLVEARSVGRLVAAVSATLASAALAPGLAMAAVVVASSGPSASAYPVGRKLDDAGSVTLKAGDTLTVLDAKGTRILRGAGTYPVAARSGAAAKTSTFAALSMQRSAQRVRTGAVRAGQNGTPAGNPNLWFVNIAKPGNRCLVQGQPVRFWRLDAAAAATWKAKTESGETVDLAFPAGAMVAPWDSQRHPLANGARLQLARVGTGPAPVVVSFSILPSQPQNVEAMAEALIAQGCTAQLDLLASTLAQP